MALGRKGIAARWGCSGYTAPRPDAAAGAGSDAARYS